jgi:hypothetical protein
MLHDTPPLPPIPVHNLPKTLRAVIQPTLRRLERRPQRRNTLASPYRTQYIPRAVKAVLRRRVVVDVVVRNVCEGGGDVFLVDKGLREGVGAEFGFWFGGVGAADAGWGFGGAGLSFLDGCGEDCEGREERGDEGWDVHCFDFANGDVELRLLIEEKDGVLYVHMYNSVIAVCVILKLGVVGIRPITCCCLSYINFVYWFRCNQVLEPHRVHPEYRLGVLCRSWVAVGSLWMPCCLASEVLVRRHTVSIMSWQRVGTALVA